MSTWKIESVIRRYKLDADQNKAEKTARKRARARQKAKKRTTQLVKGGEPCFLFQLDMIVIQWNSLQRYVMTAVDHATKLGCAGMRKNKRSRSAADFLYRLRYLVGQPIENLQTDNASEIAWEFERADGSYNTTSIDHTNHWAILPLWNILNGNLLGSVVQCYPCGQPADALDKTP